MLGVGTWFTALAVPTIATGVFVASRKRLGLQWREELMDPEGNIYPVLTESDVEHIRKVSPEMNCGVAPAGIAIAKKENIGIAVALETFDKLEADVLLDEVRRWMSLYGLAMDPRKVARYQELLQTDSPQSVAESTRAMAATPQAAGLQVSNDKPQSFSHLLDPSVFERISIISDHPEDIQLMKAPWGAGDRMQLSHMPASLRHVIERVQGVYEGLGRIRHVYVEYFPDGEMYHEPRPTKAFDGHDYVVIPLHRDKVSSVVTLTPTLRSKFALMKEVLYNSWTSRDYDVRLKCGSIMRVYGSARYDWSWGIRPGDTWFGNCHNILRRSPAEHPDEFNVNADAKSWYALGKGLLSWPAAPAEAPTLSSSIVDNSLTANSSAMDLTNVNDAAVIVLHFEGPRAKGKKRSLLMHPEALIFGSPPTVETYEQWTDDRPTAAHVQEEGVLMFVLKNYLNMLRSS